MLETWEAKRLERIIPSGRTRPLVVDCSRCDEETREEVEYAEEGSLKVVKAFDLPEITQFGLFSEVFGNSLARFFGIDTPEPCLVHLSIPFVEASNWVLEREGLRVKPGLASGCQYFSRGYSNVVPETLSPSELQEAADIYAFDLLVQNPDRTKRRPNCAMFSAHLTAFDFETAFSFILLVGLIHKPWEVSKHGIGQSHVFHPILKARKKEISWRHFISRLRRLTKVQIDELAGGLPDGWLEHAPKVRAHILSVVDNAKEFEFELRRSLL